MQAKCLQPPRPLPTPQPAKSRACTNPRATSTSSFALRLALSWSWRRINFQFSPPAFCLPHIWLWFIVRATHSPVFTCSLHVLIFWYNHNLHISPLWTAVIFILCKCPVSSQYAAHEWLPVHHCSGFIEHIRKQSWEIWGKKCLCRAEYRQ